MPSIDDLPAHVLRRPLHEPHPGRRSRPRSLVVVVLGRRMAARLVRAPRAATRSAPAIVARSLVLVVGLPVGCYLGSPIFIRTALVEPRPDRGRTAVAPVDARPRRRTRSPTSVTGARPGIATAGRIRRTDAGRDAVRRRAGSPPASFTAPTTSTSVAGTATIIETAPGSLPPSPRGLLGPQRPGPVRLPVAGPRRLRGRGRSSSAGSRRPTVHSATTLPAGTDPADFASAIIWCKQFCHLFAVAPFAAA